jgi:hypothetical protein
MARPRPTAQNDPAPTRRLPLLRPWVIAAAILLWLAASLVVTVLGVGTLAPALAVAASLLIAALRPGWPRRGALAAAGACFAIVAWRAALTPRGDRQWTLDVSITPAVDIEGDLVTVTGVRNFRWLDAERCEPAWETRSYRLSRLRGLDVIMEPLGACDLMAHTMLSFDFGEDGRILLSIEARQEVGEPYGAIPGGLNQFELIYIFADERDALGQRALAGYELYCFPAEVGPLKARAFFLSLCATAENLRQRPRFYQIIRDNCTTAWLAHSDMLDPNPVGLTLDTILTGRIGRLMHERGLMATELDYHQAKQRFRIDARVREHSNAAEFEQRIREAPPPPSP